MDKIIKKLLDRFKAEDGTTGNSKITNKVLLNELINHFRERLENESVGQRMLYPMSFNILMHPDDYNDRIQSLPFVLPEVVSAFYGIISNKRSEFPNYEPPAKYWYFQFSACRHESISDSVAIVRKGHVTTVSTLLTFDIKKARNTLADTNTHVSIKLDDSNVMNDVNVNRDAIKTLDIIGDNIFTYNFDRNLNQSSSDIQETSNMAEFKGLAVLSYSRSGKNYYFTMRDNTIYISGQGEKRTGRSFFIIENTDIADSHVQIRYLPSEKKFQIAAFGPTRLNTVKMNESHGGNIVWYDLSNKSSIFINNIVSVKFEIK